MEEKGWDGRVGGGRKHEEWMGGKGVDGRGWKEKKYAVEGIPRGRDRSEGMRKGPIKDQDRAYRD